MTIARAIQAVGGALIGLLVAVFLPPIAFAIAIVAGVLMSWATVREHKVESISPVVAGYLLGVLGYAVLALIAAFTGDPGSGAGSG